VSVRELFKAWDFNMDGMVSKKEFLVALPAMGFELSSSALEDLYDVLDEDGGGEIRYSELDKKLRRLRARSPSPGPDGTQAVPAIVRREGFKQVLKLMRMNAEKVVSKFKTWDRNSNGTLSKPEFKEMLPRLINLLHRNPSELLKMLRESDVDDLFDFFDADMSNSIAVDELRDKLLKKKNKRTSDPCGTSAAPPPAAAAPQEEAAMAAAIESPPAVQMDDIVPASAAEEASVTLSAKLSPPQIAALQSPDQNSSTSLEGLGDWRRSPLS